MAGMEQPLYIGALNRTIGMTFYDKDCSKIGKAICWFRRWQEAIAASGNKGRKVLRQETF